MPANRHLNWFEITDFTPGLFGETVVSANQLLMPVNGFARLLNYVPMKQGGVRAFYKIAGTMACTGRTSGSHGSNNEAPVGLLAHAALGGDNIILITHNSNDHKDRVYLWKGNAGASSWCVAGSCTAGSTDSVQPPDFVFFLDNNGIQYYVFVMRGVGDAQGVYSITYKPDGTTSPSGVTANGYFQRVDTYTGPLGINGARILVGDGTIGAKLRWTDEGELSFSVDNNGIFSPNDEGAGFRGIVSIQPDSFLVMRGGAPWLQFNGDVGTNGTNRDMADDHGGRGGFQQPVRVPSGIAFIEPGGNIYVTDGNTFTNISPQLPAFSAQVLGAQASSTVTAPGQLTFINGFLFAPDGKVLHWDTMSWFQIDDSTAQTAATSDRLYYTIRTDGTPVKWIDMFQGDNATRASTGTIQTAPFADKNGRNVEIREIQVFLESYASGATIQCDLVDGDDNVVSTRNSDTIGAGRDVVRFLFPSPKAHYLSARFTIAGGGSNEAPTIERIRIGFGQNNDIVGA
jgi:hypothetical protein